MFPHYNGWGGWEVEGGEGGQGVGGQKLWRCDDPFKFYPHFNHNAS